MKFDEMNVKKIQQDLEILIKMSSKQRHRVSGGG